jgi:hypothetical protein
MVSPYLRAIVSATADPRAGCDYTSNYQYFVEIRRVSSTRTLETLHVYLKDVFISFGILLLFTYLPITGALNLLKGRSYEENTRTFHHVLTTFLYYCGQFYEILTEWL